MRSVALFAASMTLACATTSSRFVEDVHADCATSVCARIELTGDFAAIDLHIPRALLGERETIELRFPEAVLGRDFLRTVQLSTGEPWPNVFAVESDGVSIRYFVELDPRHDVPAIRLRELSFEHPRGWHLKGYQLLPELHVDAPGMIHFAGTEAVLAPLARQDARTFRAPHAIELSRSSYELGDLLHHCATIDGLNACVASSLARQKSELDTLVELTARALRSNADRLGPLEDRTLLVSHHARGDDAFGITIGSAITILAPRIPARAGDAVGFVLIHELLHLWMPGSRSIRPLWLREGLTEYLAYLTVAEMTGVSEAELASWVSDAYRRYRAARYDMVIADTDEDIVYPAGVVAGFCLDRELFGRGSSTSEVLRTLLAGAEDRSTTAVTEDWFLAELSRVSPRAAGYFKLLISERRFNFSNCMPKVASR